MTTERFANNLIFRREFCFRVSLLGLYFFFKSLPLNLARQNFVTIFEIDLSIEDIERINNASTKIGQESTLALLMPDINSIWYANHLNIRRKVIESGELIHTEKIISTSSSRLTFYSHWQSKNAYERYYDKSRIDYLQTELTARNFSFRIIGNESLI